MLKKTPVDQLTRDECVDLAITIKDTASFFSVYFENLPFFNTQKECFEYYNAIYLEVYSVEKYSSFQSFRNCMYRDGRNYLKSKK